MRLFNTLTRKKEEFKPLKKGLVRIYVCGPTVYWFQHIGNLRSYIFSDTLRRVLEYNGLKVKEIMNVTDVGHLTSDADEGEDKMEKAAAKEHKKASDIANYYWKIFRQDFKKLNIAEPDKWTKATEHIKDQVDMVKILEKKGYTYKTSDGIYFDTSKLKDYGKLAMLKAGDLKPGASGASILAIGEKKNITDFALWKFSEKPGKRQQEWKSPWGIGFPGWHIECSAMSSKYLGKQFDIHTGGEDHIPVHHTNEIAQSEAAFGKKPWVKYWLHGAFLVSKGKKVSKSKGGLFTITELEEEGYTALDFRYLCLLTHYRKNLDFSLDALDAAKAAYRSLKNKIQTIDIKARGSDGKNYLEQFESAINDDMNMPKAIQVLQSLIPDNRISGRARLSVIKKVDTVFGLDLLKKDKVAVPADVKKLVAKREKARKNKDWAEADKLRDKVNKLGYIINDTEKGPKLRPK